MAESRDDCNSDQMPAPYFKKAKRDVKRTGQEGLF